MAVPPFWEHFVRFHRSASMRNLCGSTTLESGERGGFSSKVVCFFLKHIRLIQTYSHVIHVDSLIRKENLFQMLFTFILAFIRVIRL